MLIWSADRIVPGSAPVIAADDRALEHGIGLFETLRTWDGVPRLLDRHRARMETSARALGIPFDAGQFPDPGAIAALIAAEGLDGDVLLRITLAGGTNAGRPGPLWMRAGALPPGIDGRGARLVLAGFSPGLDDPLARHKTLNYWSRRLAHERAQADGADDALMGTPDGRIWETTRMNLFLVRDGRLATPGQDGPILPGVLRGLVLERAGAFGLEAGVCDVRADDFGAADEAFLTNSVRGVVAVGRTPWRDFGGEGPITRRIRLGLDRELRALPGGAN